MQFSFDNLVQHTPFVLVKLTVLLRPTGGILCKRIRALTHSAYHMCASSRRCFANIRTKAI